MNWVSLYLLIVSPDRIGVKPDFAGTRSVAQMCSSGVLLGLESSARDWLRSHRLPANVCESSPVEGCKYERYAHYVSTDEQIYLMWKLETLQWILMDLKCIKYSY